MSKLCITKLEQALTLLLKTMTVLQYVISVTCCVAQNRQYHCYIVIHFLSEVSQSIPEWPLKVTQSAN